MTMLNPPPGVSVADTGRTIRTNAPEHERMGDPKSGKPQPWINVGGIERQVSVAAGAIVAVAGLARRSGPGLLMAAIGGALVYRGVSGHCHAYQTLGVDTSKDADAIESTLESRGIHVEQVFTINKSVEELYGFWRDFTNLPTIMTHLKRVDVQDDGKSHWVAEAPKIAGGQVEWDAELTADEPNARIAWRSLPGSQVDNAGEVRFSKAPGDRGTEVHVTMKYLPPAGKLGHFIAKLFADDADIQIREDLRRFKRIQETGEAATTDGQPRGTCTGTGKYENA